MKLNQLVWIGLSAFVVATAPVSASPLIRAAAAPTSVAQLNVKAQSTTIEMGSFMAAEKPTTGTARIVQVGAQRYVELDSSFSTSNQGPALHVLLDPTAQPPASYQDTSQIVNLGPLQSYSGAQRYAIPANVDLSRYNSVVIWCQMANATFGYAPLQNTQAQAQPPNRYVFTLDSTDSVGL